MGASTSGARRRGLIFPKKGMKKSKKLLWNYAPMHVGGKNETCGGRGEKRKTFPFLKIDAGGERVAGEIKGALDKGT